MTFTKNISKFALIAAAALTVATTASTSHAQTELAQPGGFAGLLLGLAKPADLDSRLGYGAEIGLRFPNNLAGFGYYMGSAADQNGVNLTVSHYGLGAEYNLNNFLQGLRAGLRLGMVSASGPGTSSSSNFSFGPHIGWDYQVAPNLSVGVEPILMFDTGDNSGTSLYVFGTGRFWF